MTGLLTHPGMKHASITPNDSTDLVDANGVHLYKSLWIGGAGNLSMDDADGLAVVWLGIPAGTVIPFSPRCVNSTSTTATSIVGFM